MSSSNESIGYYSILIVGAIVRILPAPLAMMVGRFVGWICYTFITKHRRISHRNLQIALAKEKSPEEIRKILKKTYSCFGRNIVEVMRLPVVARQGYEKYVTAEGVEKVHEAMKQGKGCIFLAMHLGNWELSSLVGSMIGYPYNLVANPLKRQTRIDPTLNKYRCSGGAKIINPGLGSRGILKALKQNEVITLVVDQGGREGVLCDFFGQKASFSTGAIRLGLKYGVPIFVVNVHRVKGHKHFLEAHGPLELKNSGDMEKDLEENLNDMAVQFEQWVRENIHEYVWFYKTWKHSKFYRVMVLDDDRTGHLRQSQRIAQTVKEQLATRSDEAEITEIKINVRSKVLVQLLVLLHRLSFGMLAKGSETLLKLVLDAESFKKVTSQHADFVVSTGAKACPINYWLSYYFMAKSINILKPGMLPLEKFDLVILPQHDKPRSVPKKANLLITKVAPNLIDQEYLSKQARKLENHFSHLKDSFRMRIGVLIGGNAQKIVMTEKQMKVIANQLREVAKQLNADLLVTTSRRTPPNVEQMLIKELKKYERCTLFISANKNNIPEAVGGILGLSDLVVVSGESISMVSEAVSSGKKTVVFPIQDVNVSKIQNKYTDFADKLHNQGYLVCSNTKALGQTIYDLAKNKIKTRTLDDSLEMGEAIHKVL